MSTKNKKEKLESKKYISFFEYMVSMDLSSCFLMRSQDRIKAGLSSVSFSWTSFSATCVCLLMMHAIHLDYRPFVCLSVNQLVSGDSSFSSARARQDWDECWKTQLKPAKLDPALHDGPRGKVAYSEYALSHEMELEGKGSKKISRINTALAIFTLKYFLYEFRTSIPIAPINHQHSLLTTTTTIKKTTYNGNSS